MNFKPELKGQSGNDNQLARGGFNLSTLAAAASIQQQVPQTTASSAINMPSITVNEGLPNSPALNSGSITAPVPSPKWSQGLTEKVSWMMQGNLQSAELKLNPANLGPLEVKLSVQDDKASIVFVTAHGQVKEAIDNAMPRLREMLEQQGLDLVDVDVSQYSDAKDEQSGDLEQSEGMNEMAQNENDQKSTVVHQSTINVEQGVSIFV